MELFMGRRPLEPAKKYATDYPEAHWKELLELANRELREDNGKPGSWISWGPGESVNVPQGPFAALYRKVDAIIALTYYRNQRAETIWTVLRDVEQGEPSPV